MQHILNKVHVNIPFVMLYDNYLDLFLHHGINPEIGIDAAALERFGTRAFKEIAARVHDHGLSVTLHGPFMDLSPGSPDPAVRNLTRRRFEQLLALVPVFAPKTVVCHAGYDWQRYGHLRSQWLQDSRQMWSWMGEQTVAAGSRLMLENVYEQAPEDLLAIFEQPPPTGAGICLDTGHQAVFGRGGLKTWIDRLAPHIGQIHLHDNLGDKDAHLAPGKGSIDFQPLIDYLASQNGPGPVITLEPHCEADLWAAVDYLLTLQIL